MSKVCTECKEEKLLDDFWFNKKRNNYHSNCKICKYNKSKKYINVSKEQKAIYDKTYRSKHNETLKIKMKTYYENNKEKIISNVLENQKTLIGKLKHNIRTRLGNAIKRRSNSSKELLDCDIKIYIEYLEYQFDNDMNWENYGSYWHIDHVNPINNFDLTNIEDIKKAFHFTNTRPLSVELNLSRSKKTNIQDINEHNIIVNKFLTRHY